MGTYVASYLKLSDAGIEQVLVDCVGHLDGWPVCYIREMGYFTTGRSHTAAVIQGTIAYKRGTWLATTAKHPSKSGEIEPENE